MPKPLWQHACMYADLQQSRKLKKMTHKQKLIREQILVIVGLAAVAVVAFCWSFRNYADWNTRQIAAMDYCDQHNRGNQGGFDHCMAIGH